DKARNIDPSWRKADFRGDEPDKQGKTLQDRLNEKYPLPATKVATTTTDVDTKQNAVMLEVSNDILSSPNNGIQQNNNSDISENIAVVPVRTSEEQQEGLEQLLTASE